ncbi:hypothetical protein I552_9002 [Mycobacterium xenopi 3993]|nr:hypothetical protein I552_9002 [Mycobacterium xenopi 3993]
MAALWHATTLLREHRGDGHVAVLAAAGVSAGVQCGACGGRCGTPGLHCAPPSLRRRRVARLRRQPGRAWPAHCRRVADRRGRKLKEHIEVSTDTLALRALERLDDGEIEALLAALPRLHARSSRAATYLPPRRWRCGAIFSRRSAHQLQAHDAADDAGNQHHLDR